MSVVRGIKVGTTDITSTYTDSGSKSDSKSLTVTAVELYSIEIPNDVTYTGFEHCPHPVVSAIVDGNDTILTEDTDYTLSYLNNINAGTATVTATGINNFTGTLSANWTIIPADMDVEYENQSYLYNGSNQGVGVDVTTIYDNPTIKYGIVSGTYNLSSAPQIRNVDDSKTIYYKVTAPNHNPVEGSYTITITPMTVNLQWGDSEWVYDGEEHSTTCVVDNLVSGDSCSVVLIDNSATNIGNYVVTAESLGNSNYVLPITGNKYGITIKPGLFIKISGSWVPVKAVYEKINGSWVKKTIGDNTFDIDVLYMNRN